MAKTVTARANRSFATIRQGDVVTISEDDARLQAYLASGYLTEVEGDDAKNAKKVETLDDGPAEVVWDGKPGNRRGTTVEETATTEDHTDEKTSKVTKSTAPKASDESR